MDEEIIREREFLAVIQTAARASYRWMDKCNELSKKLEKVKQENDTLRLLLGEHGIQYTEIDN